MSIECNFYRWAVRGEKIEIEFQAARSIFGMTVATAFIRYDGSKQPDGSIFWLRDDGAIVGEALQRKLDRIHQQYSLKHGLSDTDSSARARAR